MQQSTKTHLCNGPHRIGHRTANLTKSVWNLNPLKNIDYDSLIYGSVKKNQKYLYTIHHK